MTKKQTEQQPDRAAARPSSSQTQLIDSLEEKIQKSIAFLKEHEPVEGYYLAFSGGKDSIVCHQLCTEAGVKFHPQYAMTTIDPPDIPKFIRENYPHVEFIRPVYKGEETNFYALVAQKGLPNRLRRWCCQVMKETKSPKGSTVVLGVRAAESPKRAKRQMLEEYNGRFQVNVIVEWTDEDVWNFIHMRNLKYPSLYDNGHKRIGCIMCPLACKKARVRDYNEYPNVVKAIEKNLQTWLDTKHVETKWGKNAHEIVYYWVHNSPIESAKGPCMSHGIEEPEQKDNNQQSLADF